jgi:Na+/melibiose symporter-like transporter
VAILSATGVFFITYKVSEKTLENTLSLLAGAGAILIPLFPTARPDKTILLTPLQNLMGEHSVWIVHFLASTLFLVSLMGISFWNGSETTFARCGSG